MGSQARITVKAVIYDSSPASWFLASVDAPFHEGVVDDPEISEQERVEVRLWHSLQLRSHRSTGTRRCFSQTGTARSVPCRVVGRGGRGMDSGARRSSARSLTSPS